MECTCSYNKPSLPLLLQLLLLLLLCHLEDERRLALIRAVKYGASTRKLSCIVGPAVNAQARQALRS
jgi:hypothetical protein